MKQEHLSVKCEDLIASPPVKTNTDNEPILKSRLAPETLTRRATLTNLNAFLEQFCRLISGMVISPLVIVALGAELYGAWSMISQLQGYFALSDFRSAGTLKVLLSVQQHRDNFDEKRRLVGAAIFVWLISLLVLLVAGLIVLPLSHHIIATSPAYAPSVRMALFFVLVTVAVTQFFSIAGCVLRGSNLDYKSMGLRSVVNLIVAVLGLMAVKAGFGVSGLAAAGVAGSALVGLMFCYLAKKYVSWFGAAMPACSEVHAFGKTTGWFMLISIGQAVLTSSDVLIIGILISPGVAGMYAATGALMRFVTTPIVTIIASSNAGLAGLCGKQEWNRVVKVASELSSSCVLIVMVIGTIVLSLNQAFMHKWVGDGFFAGQPLTLGIILLYLVLSAYRIAAILVDGILEFRSKSYVLLVTAGGGLLLCILLARLMGTMGVVIGMIVGVTTACGWLMWILCRRVKLPPLAFFGDSIRPLMVGLGLLAAGYFITPAPSTWLGVGVVGLTIGIVASVCMFYLGLNQDIRERIWLRITVAVGRGAR